PTPPPSVDYQAVLLSLADEYMSGAYSMSSMLVAGDYPENELAQYHQLVSTAMGCLESVLQNYRQQDPRKEARIRLRLATLLFDETENAAQVEEVLSKGIALCERSRLVDLKYAMHHLLVRQAAKTSPKAAVKTIEILIAEVETLGLTHWIYVFRFLRVTLGLQRSDIPDIANLIKHLESVVSKAKSRGDVTVQIVATALEIMLHLRSDSSEKFEHVQRAFATARMHQLSPEMQALPQVRALLDCLDLACALMQFSPDQIAEKLQAMHNNMDEAARDKGWTKDGSFVVPLGVAASGGLELETAGILTSSSDGKASLAFQWLPRGAVYTLGYLLSGIATSAKHPGDSKAESYLNEALKLVTVKAENQSQPLSAVADATSWEKATNAATRLQLVFAHCNRFDWIAASKALEELDEMSAQSEVAFDDLTAVTATYLNAVCKQGLGDIPGASELYALPQLKFKSNSKAPSALKDIQATATLSRILILRHEGDVQQADQLLGSVESYCLTHGNKSLVAAYYIVKSLNQAPNNAIIKLKQFLQSAVQAAKTASNQPLICIVMNLMTQSFFSNIIGDQAVKSARVSRTLALKANNRLWTAVADRMYAGTLELSGEGKDAENARRDAIENMQKLPEPLK
ncbi:hypothetical protein BAUCODRAFT_47807, partial [Baudoinia panamericana UAMH 10762]